MALTDLAYKIIALVLLTPAMALLTRAFVTFSGKPGIADTDILAFFLTPLGLVAFIAFAAASLAIGALELGGLMTVGLGARAERGVDFRAALTFVALRSAGVVELTARIVARCLLIAVPFLAAAGLIYGTLLGEFDINFYLAEKPPAFWAAVIIGAGLGLGLSALLIRVLTGWILSLPILLFESKRARDAMRVSAMATDGHRKWIGARLAGWIGVTLVASSLSAGMVTLFGGVLVAHFQESLAILVVVLGGIISLGAVLNLLIAFASGATLALMVAHLYEATREEAARPDVVVASRSLAESMGLRLPRLAWLGLAVAALIAATVTGIVMLNSLSLEDHTEVMAHRGASAKAPENTLAAVEQAIADGTEWVEIDVQETRDGEVIVLHDSDFKKIAGVDLKIWDATLADLADIDIGSSFGTEFSEERIPTLRQVLELCKGRARVNIELKYYGHDERLEQRVVELVEATGMEAEIIVMSLKYEGIQKIRALRPRWKVGLLAATALGDLTRLDVDFLAVHAGLASASFVARAHRSDKQVLVWTVNDILNMSAMMSLGVDGIITDEPGLAIRVREERKRLSPTERLLLEWARFFGASAEDFAPARDIDAHLFLEDRVPRAS